MQCLVVLPPLTMAKLGLCRAKRATNLRKTGNKYFCRSTDEVMDSSTAQEL